MQILTIILLAGLGLIVGSFLNAYVWRFGQKDMSVRRGSSQCVHCKHALSALDLVPLVSFAALLGRCRYCRKPISWRYPIVELATAVITLLPVAVFGLTLTAGVVLVLSWLLEAMFLIDHQYAVLPDSLTIPAILIGILCGWLLGHSYVAIIAGGILGAAFFAVQYLISRGVWVGSGDIRLGAVMGVTLGWQFVLAALMLAYVVGAVVAVVLLVRRRTSWSSQIPFGTFLTLATYIMLLAGDRVLYWMGFR